MLNKNRLMVAALCLASGIAAATGASAQPERLTDGRSEIGVEDLTRELSALAKPAREAMLKDKRAMQRFVSTLLLSRRIESEARKRGLQESHEFKAEIVKSQREALVRLYVERVLERAVAETPSDELLTPLAKELYLANLVKYKLPERREYVHLLVKVDPEAGIDNERNGSQRAAEYLRQVRAGTPLEELAGRYSDDEGSKKHGGKSPQPVTPGQTVPPFDRALFSMQVGDISDLVRTRFGFHIIKLTAIEPERTRSFEEVAPEILKSIRAQRTTEARDKIMAEFQGPEPIEISDEFMRELNAAR